MAVIKLDSPQLKKLVEQKEQFVKIGRAESRKIDELEKAMKSAEKKLVKEEGKVDTKDFRSQMEDLKNKAITLSNDIEAVQKKIYDKIMAETPQELRDEYDKLSKEKEVSEKKRNTMGLKIQAVKDRIIPLVQKIGQPYLTDEYDDFETTRLNSDGEVELVTFNHLQEFKSNFRKK